MRLSVQNISKAYGANRALQGFSAELEPGIYALLGPNGSGKSTLMNIITGNLRADEGDICFETEGRTESIFKMGNRFCQRLGYMPQYPGFYPNFTVEQFLWYVATLKDMGKDLSRKERKEQIAKAITELLIAVELEDVRARRIKTLSGGMKQRLGLAQAVLGDPAVLILDEPTAGLDPKQRIAVRNFISRIAFDKIVIFATHVVPDVEFIARRVIMLKKGVIADHDTPEALTDKIKGKVWQITCTEDDVAGLQIKYRVTNITHKEGGGGVLLRVLSEARPTETAEELVPTLEDYYLYVFGEEIEEPPSQPANG